MRSCWPRHRQPRTIQNQILDPAQTPRPTLALERAAPHSPDQVQKVEIPRQGGARRDKAHNHREATEGAEEGKAQIQTKAVHRKNKTGEGKECRVRAAGLHVMSVKGGRIVQSLRQVSDS